MRQIIPVLLILLISSPASAALSAAEKAEINKIVAAINGVNLAFIDLGNAIYYRNATSHASLNTVYANLLTTQGNLVQGYARLTYTNPAEQSDTTTYNTYEALARASWVTEAMTYIATAATNVTTSSTSVDAALAVVGRDASGDTYLDLVKTRLSDAATSLASFDTTGTYLGPRDTIWAPQIVSPHGTLIPANRLMLNSLTRHLAALESFRKVFNPTELSETALGTTTTINTAYQTLLLASGELMSKWVKTIALWINVPDSKHCQFSPHHFMGRVVELLMQGGSESNSQTSPHKGAEHGGAPYRFHMAAVFKTTFLDALRASLPTRPIAWGHFNAGIGHYFESWEAQTGGVDQIMTFPAGVTKAQLGTQAGRTNDDNDPPLCPDTVDPIVSVEYPTAGQTLGGRQTITIYCEDDIGTTPAPTRVACNKVDIKIGGSTVATVTTPPYEYRWNTADTGNGAVNISCTGYDAAGRTANCANVSVTVAN